VKKILKVCVVVTTFFSVNGTAWAQRKPTQANANANVGKNYQPQERIAIDVLAQIAPALPFNGLTVIISQTGDVFLGHFEQAGLPYAGAVIDVRVGQMPANILQSVKDLIDELPAPDVFDKPSCAGESFLERWRVVKSNGTNIERMDRCKIRNVDSYLAIEDYLRHLKGQFINFAYSEKVAYAPRWALPL